jgi:branched-chain amino acid transport system permease protein
MKFLKGVRELDLWVQLIINGLAIGMAYALVAVGLALIFSIYRVINFAHGEFYMLGAVFAYGVTQLTGNYWLGLAGSGIGVAVVAMIAERLIFRFTYAAHHLVAFLASAGLLLVLQNTVAVVLGGESQLLNSPLQGSYTYHSVMITWHRLLVCGVSIILGIGLWFAVVRTRWGRMVMASAEDRFIAEVVGVRTGFIGLSVFAVSGGLAGIAGGCLAPILAVDAFMGTRMLVIAFSIVTLTGTGKVLGVIPIAIVLGIVEALSGGLLSDSYALIVVFVLLIIAIVIRGPRLLAN